MVSSGGQVDGPGPQAGCLAGACFVHSMWEGYLADDKQKPFLGWLEKHGIPMHKGHTSGHASLRDLRRLRNAFASAVVVPVHTEHPALFKDLFKSTAMHEDNEWWEV